MMLCIPSIFESNASMNKQSASDEIPCASGLLRGKEVVSCPLSRGQKVNKTTKRMTAFGLVMHTQYFGFQRDDQSSEFSERIIAGEVCSDISPE
jgi:hypothetical protein